MTVPTAKGYLVFLLSFLLLATEQTDGREPTHSGDLLGASMLLSTTPLGPQDAYSNPVGLSLFYDSSRFLPWKAIRLGATLSSYQMLPRRSEFGSSIMLLSALTGRLETPGLFGAPGLVFSPFASIGSYLRWYSFLSDGRFAARPAFSLGGDFRLSVDSSLMYAAGLSYTALWEERLRSLFALSISLGYRFDG